MRFLFISQGKLFTEILGSDDDERIAVLKILYERIDSTKQSIHIEDRTQCFSILVRVSDGILWYRVVYDGWSPDPCVNYGFGDDSDEEYHGGFTYFDVDMFGNVYYDTGDGNYLKASSAYEQKGWVAFHSVH